MVARNDSIAWLLGNTDFERVFHAESVSFPKAYFVFLLFHELSPPAFKFLKTARAVTIRETEKDDSGTPFQVFRTAVLRSRGFLFTLAHHHQVVGVLVFSILVVPSGFLLISVVQFLILISTVPVASSGEDYERG